MVLHQPKHDPIIEIYFQELMNKFLERRNHYLGKDCRCVLQSEWHNCILEATPLRREGFLALILLLVLVIFFLPPVIKCSLSKCPLGFKVKFL